MKFTTFAKVKEHAEEIVNSINEECTKNGLVYDDNNPDFVFVIGGDGTFLRAVHKFIDKLDKVRFIGIRFGTLGFFYEFDKENIEKIVSLLLKNDYSVEKHSLLKCQLGDKVLYAVNEVSFENPFHTLVCNVKINDEDLERFHGNGLLVCSALGSSAYNKSIGGSVVSRNLDCLQLTELATIQNNIYRSLGSSLIVSKDTVFSFEGDFSNVVVAYDHLTCDSNGSNMIRISSSSKEVQIVYSKEFSHLDSLKRSFIK